MQGLQHLLACNVSIHGIPAALQPCLPWHGCSPTPACWAGSNGSVSVEQCLCDGGWNGANGTLCRTLMELLEESRTTAVVTVMAPGLDREPQV